MCQIGSKTEIELFAISVFVCLFMYASLTWHLVPAFRKTTMRNLNCWFLYVLFFHWICLFCDLHMILFSNYKPQVPYRISFSFCLSRIIWTWSICASKKKLLQSSCLFICLLLLFLQTRSLPFQDYLPRTTSDHLIHDLTHYLK